MKQEEKAIEYFEQALAITMEMGNRYVECNLRNNMGNAFMNLGQLDQARMHYQHALEIAQ